MAGMGIGRRGWAAALGLGLGLALLLPGPVARAEDPKPTAVEIEVPAFAGFPAAAMPTQLFLPPGAGPFPVVIFSHGRASKPADRAALRAPIPLGHAGYWLRKGFAVVAPIRPGYGVAGAVDRERSGTRLAADGSCDGNVRVEEAARAAETAVRAAVDWTRRQPWAAKNRLLLVGQSVGGMTTVVLGSDNPPGVVGFINFSGGAAGYPTERPGASCGEDALAALYAKAGRRAHVPSLWLYAENDRFWGAQAPRRWHAAFAAGGSRSTFVMTTPVADPDGHNLLRRGGRLWSSHVDPFVAGLGL